MIGLTMRANINMFRCIVMSYVGNSWFALACSVNCQPGGWKRNCRELTTLFLLDSSTSPEDGDQYGQDQQKDG